MGILYIDNSIFHIKEVQFFKANKIQIKSFNQNTAINGHICCRIRIGNYCSLITDKPNITRIWLGISLFGKYITSPITTAIFNLQAMKLLSDMQVLKFQSKLFLFHFHF